VDAPSGSNLLSKKMKITVPSARLERFSSRHVNFYSKYASYVFKALSKPSFQKFLSWMLKRENIEEQMITDVHVRVLPFRKKNGNGLAGNCDIQNGIIQIYPRTRKFCTRLKREFGKNGFLSYVRIRARAALIHELLHLKYGRNEEKVRQATKEYTATFSRKRLSQNPALLTLYAVLFQTHGETIKGESTRTRVYLQRS
jgi:hypothetical protein